MKKMVLGLAILVGLVCAEEPTREQISKIIDERCKNGDSMSCEALGEVHLYGTDGFVKDYKKAKFYYEKVCKKGNENYEHFSRSCLNLGVIYADGGYGVPQDSKKALKFYNLACDMGNVVACENLGSVYFDGEGVSQDIIKDAEYVKRACDAGSWMACKNFAVYHYKHGDRSKVAQYLKKACELGRNDYGVKNDPEDREIWQEAYQIAESSR
ncbi:MAG: tetratricopeptide repeat protein [Wolinella sp.]